MGIISVISAIGGAVAGAAADQSVFGFVAGGLIGYLLANVIHLKNRVTFITNALETLRSTPVKTVPPQPVKQEPQKSAPATQTTSTDAAITKKPASQPATARSVAEATIKTPAPKQPSEPQPVSTPPAQKPALDISKIKNLFSGTNSVVILGVSIFFLGFVFVVKYAIEHSLVPIEVRLAAAMLTGTIMVFVGWRLRNKNKSYAVVIQGGGIAILYLAVFAAFRLYQLIPSGAAFGSLVVITIIGMFLSVADDSKTLAVISSAGGFLAPILTSTGSGNYVALFSYYTLLNSGILGVALFRSWRILNLTGFLFTHLIALIWGANSYQSEFLVNCEIFLNIFFIMFALISILYSLKHPPQIRGIIDGTLVFGLPLTYLGFQYRLVGEFEYGLSIVSLAMGGFYILSSLFLQKRKNEGLRDLVDSFIALGVIFANLSIPLAFSAPATSAFWAFEGAALVWVGLRQNRNVVTGFGFLLQLGSWISFVVKISMVEPDLFFNGQLFGFLLIIGSSLFSAWQIHIKNDAKNWMKEFIPIFLIAGFLWWLLAGFPQMLYLTPSFDYMAVVYPLFYAITLLILDFASQRLHWDQLKKPFTLFPVVLILSLLTQANNATLMEPFLDGGYFAWPLNLSILYFILYRARNNEATTPIKIAHFTGAAIMAAVVSLECHTVVQRVLPDPAVWSAIFMVLPLSVLLILFTSPFIYRGLFSVQLQPFYYNIVNPALGYTLLFFVLVLNFTGDGSATPLPYIPLLNPTELFSLIAFGAFWRWHTTNKWIKPEAKNFTVVLLAVALFLFVNLGIARIIHHLSDVAWSFNGMYRSTPVQITYSIFWGIMGFVFTITGNRKGSRLLWLAGALFFALVLVKLFFVDLASTQNVIRMITFVSVGGLLIIVGYFAPVPPAKKDKI